MEAWKIGLIGVAGFGLYEYLSGGLSSLFGGATTTSVPASSTPIPTAPVVPPSNPMPSSAQLIAAAGATTQNIYQWNYWYEKLTGRGSSFNLVTFPVDGGTSVTADTYLSYLQGLGLSGLGTIIDLTDYLGQGDGFGTDEFTSLGMLEDEPMNSAAYIDENVFNEAAGINGGNDGTVTDFLLAASGVGA